MTLKEIKEIYSEDMEVSLIRNDMVIVSGTIKTIGRKYITVILSDSNCPVKISMDDGLMGYTWAYNYKLCLTREAADHEVDRSLWISAIEQGFLSYNFRRNLKNMTDDELRTLICLMRKYDKRGRYEEGEE